MNAARRGCPPFEPVFPPSLCPSHGLFDFWATGLTIEAWRLSRAAARVPPWWVHLAPWRPPLGPPLPLPFQPWSALETASDLRRRVLTAEGTPLPAPSMDRAIDYGRTGYRTTRTLWPWPFGPRALNLDVRPYLAAPAPRPGPLLKLHALLDHLHRPQPLATPVRATRARVTDVVPLPDGIRGRWEAWSVAIGPAAAADLSATGRRLVAATVQAAKVERGLVRRATRDGLTLTRASEQPAVEPEVPRYCDVCRKPLPKGSRSHKRVHRGTCSQKQYRQNLKRKAAA